MAGRGRAAAIGLALLLVSAGLTSGLLAASAWVDTVYAERRFVLPKRECPLLLYREYAAPECGWLMPAR